MILLSLASKQIWPQVLSALHMRPRQIMLFHSAEEGESRRPAERLKAFFEGSAKLAPVEVLLRPVPHDQFQGVVDAFANTAEEHALDHSNCIVNLTGGNKLMAMAASEWCRLAGVRCFYLERDLRVFPFLPKGTDLLPQPDFKLDPHLARDIEPLALLGCQLEGAEIVNPGQRLTLNQAGQNTKGEISAMLTQGYDFRKLLNWDVPETERRQGDGLEYAVAFCLLKLGVPIVQRGVRLVPRVLRSSGKEEGEVDLIFNWSGKLWVVDCKDRIDAVDRVGRLRTEILSQTPVTARLDSMLNDLAEEVRERDLKPLKEDLLIASEAAGLLGRALCVRRSLLPVQAQEFARSRNLPVLYKDNLFRDLRTQLFPDQPASMEQLRTLAAARTAARP